MRVATRLTHVTVGTADLAAALAFYDAALAPLGLGRVAEFGDEEEDNPTTEAAGWGNEGQPPLLWLVTTPDATRRAHLSLRADSTDQVRAFHAAALAAGGRSQRAPRRWTVFRRGDFAAAVADRDGNVVEVTAREQSST